MQSVLSQIIQFIVPTKSSVFQHIRILQTYMRHVSVQMNRLKGVQYSYVVNTVRLVGTTILNALI